MRRILLAAVISLILFGCGGNNAADAKNSESEAVEDAEYSELSDFVTLAIYGKDKELLGTADIQCGDDGVTVIDLLKEGTDSIDMAITVSGAGKMAYVKEIAGFAEFGDGSGSGWIFNVDGKTSSKGIGAVTVNAGQIVEFYYTLDMGKDVS